MLRPAFATHSSYSTNHRPRALSPSRRGPLPFSTANLLSYRPPNSVPVALFTLAAQQPFTLTRHPTPLMSSPSLPSAFSLPHLRAHIHKILPAAAQAEVIVPFASIGKAVGCEESPFDAWCASPAASIVPFAEAARVEGAPGGRKWLLRPSQHL